MRRRNPYADESVEEMLIGVIDAMLPEVLRLMASENLHRHCAWKASLSFQALRACLRDPELGSLWRDHVDGLVEALKRNFERNDKEKAANAYVAQVTSTAKYLQGFADARGLRFEGRWEERP